MKAVKITLAGRTQYLAYTGEAMFQLQEKFGTAAELLGAIGKNTRDGLSVACEAAAHFGRARRARPPTPGLRQGADHRGGHDPGHYYTERDRGPQARDPRRLWSSAMAGKSSKKTTRSTSASPS